MNDFIIRPVTLDDAKALLDIYAYYIEKTAITFETEIPTIDSWTERIKNISSKYPYLVYEENGIILGYVYAHEYSERAAYNWTVETSIYIDKNARRKGIGKKLYKALEEELKKIEVVNLLAGVAYSQNEDEYLSHDSPEFHKKLGYSISGHLITVGKKFDRWYDILWMQKKI